MKDCWPVKRRRRQILLVPVLLGGFVTILFTSLPLTAQQRALIGGRDKWIHAAVFAALTVSMAWALAGFLRSRIRVLGLTLVLLLCFASIDEFAQKYVPTRTVDWWDWLANCLGISLGLILYTAVSVLASAICGKADKDVGRSLGDSEGGA